MALTKSRNRMDGNSFATVSDLLVTDKGYADFPAGTYLFVNDGDFTYKVAASGATDHHLTTTGGGSLKLYVQPGANGRLPLDAFGAGAGNDADDIAALKKALSLGMAIEMTSGSTYASLSNGDDTKTPQFANNTALWMNGATIRHGSDETYLPALWIRGLDYFELHGPGTFVNEGSVDGTESLSETDVTRLGLTAVPREFNNAIVVRDCLDGIVDGIRSQGETSSNTMTNAVTCIASSVQVSNIYARDVSCVIITGGAPGVYDSRLINIDGDYLNSNNMIPGHVIYCLGGVTLMANITDGGNDTGNTAEPVTVARQPVIHTLQVKNTDGLTVTGVSSKRAQGVLSFQEVTNSSVTGVYWVDDEAHPVPPHGALLFENGEGNSVTDFVLKTDRDYHTIWLGDDYTTVRGRIIRNASTTHSLGYARIRGNGCDAELECVNNGSAVIPTWQPNGNGRYGNRLHARLAGSNQTPKVEFSTLNQWWGNRFTFDTSIESNPYLDPPMNYADVELADAQSSRSTIVGATPVFVNVRDSVTGSPSSVDYRFQLPKNGAYSVFVLLEDPANLGNSSCAFFDVVSNDQAVDLTSTAIRGSQIDSGSPVFGTISTSVNFHGAFDVTASMSTPTDYDITIGAQLISSLSR